MRHRAPITLAVVFGLLALSSTASADTSISQESVNRAHRHLIKKQTGLDVLSFVHFGAAYKSHAYIESRGILDAKGKVRPGYFALVYRYQWEDDGVSDIAFFCDPKGNVYNIAVTKSNALLQQPFALADLTIELLREFILEAMSQDLSPATRDAIRQAVKQADSRNLLMLYVRMTQS